MTTGKTIALTRWTFVGKVISLLFNILSRLFIPTLSRSKCLFNFMAAVTICSDFGAHVANRWRNNGRFYFWGLQYFDHLIRGADSLEKTLMMCKISGGRRRGQRRMRWLDGITDVMNMSLSKESDTTQRLN